MRGSVSMNPDSILGKTWSFTTLLDRCSTKCSIWLSSLNLEEEEEEEEKEEEKGKEKEMGKSNLAFLSLLEKSLTMHGTILAWNSTVSSSFPIWGEEKVREEEVEE